MKNSIKKKNNLGFVKLEDYKIFDYEIPEIFLDFVIDKNKVTVKTQLKLNRLNKGTTNLTLDGKDICIKKIYLDKSLLEKKNYLQQTDILIINNINKESFTLTIEGIIRPKDNISLLGMYESNVIITTQCEAYGFRRIS